MEQSELPGEVANHNSASPCVLHATIRGTIGFGLVSLAAFSIWALGGKWLESHFGEIGLYLACAVVFIAMSGLLLYPLMRGSGSLLHFYKVFMPAFLGYAIVWCVAWFALRFGLGEWLGSLLGSAAFVGVMSWQMRNARNFVLTTLIVFAMNSTGYFLGGKLMHWILAAGRAGVFSGFSKSGILVFAKLGWGLLYGLGFGAGIGFAFHALRSDRVQPAAGAVETGLRS